MGVRTSNEFLEDEESEEDLDHGRDSEEVEESRGTISRRAPKRRRVESASDEEPPEELAGSDSDTGAYEDNQVARNGSPVQNDDGEIGEDGQESTRPVPATARLDAATLRHATAAQKVARKSGVVYISRVPPFMKPQTLKHFLAPHASKGLGRLFLTPEDSARRSRRVHSGGNKKKSYADGWVEFSSKREAKIAAETLNGNIIGGRKGNYYHDDLWNMRYLKGFKWNHLTEQIANENAERAARMREEVRKTRQENKAFVQDIERGKMIEGIQAKRKLKGIDPFISQSQDERQKERNGKSFKQKHPQESRRDADKPSEQASRMQRMIF